MRARISTILATALLLALLGSLSGTAHAAVSSNPATTPQIVDTGPSGTTERVRQIVQCGTTMYAVGIFSQVRDAGSTNTLPRGSGVAFSAIAPHRVTAWNPKVNGRLDTVECAPDGSIIVGGSFSSAGGAANRNLARVNAVTGAALPFAFDPTGRVAHVESVRDAAGVPHLLVGGFFPGFLRSVDPVTGAADGYGMPAISGTYVYEGVSREPTQVYNMTVSPSGGAVLMAGVFTSVGGQRHEQLFRLNLTAGSATVSAWAPTELEVHCAGTQSFYARDAAWAPDESRIYTATTGYKPIGTSAAAPRTGPCDAIIAYPVTQTRFNGHTWINYTGCDSLWSVAADATTVFAGGHQRWASNPLGCDAAGPGAITQQGLTEVHPSNGAHQPGPNHARGVGPEDLLRTAAGLWIASDNRFGGDRCANERGHAGICFLPN